MRTLTSPHDLLAAVPFLIGYHPENSLVLISLEQGRVGLAMRIDYPTEVDPEQIELLLLHLRREDCDGVLIVAYAPEGIDPAHEISSALALHVGIAGLRVQESLLVREGRWRSLMCRDFECCPLEGRVLPEFSDSAVTAGQVADGVPLPFNGSDSLRASLYAKSPSIALLTALATYHPIDYSRKNFQSLQREGAVAVNQLVEKFREDGILVNESLVAQVLVRLLDLQVRDYALGIATDENQELLISLWRWLTSIAPQGFAAAPATLYAELVYEHGEGALAARALERAFDDDSTYQLAKLLRRSFAAGWEPSNFRQMRSELHPKICQALFAEEIVE